MKRLIITISLCFLLAACKGSTSLPLNYSIETMGLEASRIGLIDRKVEKIELDVSEKGVATLIITMEDEIQIDKRRLVVPYRIYIRFYENKRFAILR